MKKLLFIIAIAAGVVSCNSNSKNQNEAVEDTITTETVSVVEVVENDSTAKPVVLDFTADWCMWCKRLEPTLNKLKEKYVESVEFKTIDRDINPELAQQYGIEGLPTLVFLDKNGKEVTRIVGYTNAENIETAISQIK